MFVFASLFFSVLLCKTMTNASLNCSRPYSLYNNRYCFYLERKFTGTFEESMRKCQNIGEGGRIVSSNFKAAGELKSASDEPTLFMWVAGSDLLMERHQSKTGWKFMDDQLINESDWNTGEPNGSDGEDCVAVMNGFLVDIPCQFSQAMDLVCEWQPRASASCTNNKVKFVGDLELHGGVNVKNNDNEEGIIMKFSIMTHSSCSIMFVNSFVRILFFIFNIKLLFSVVASWKVVSHFTLKKH